MIGFTLTCSITLANTMKEVLDFYEIVAYFLETIHVTKSESINETILSCINFKIFQVKGLMRQYCFASNSFSLFCLGIGI